MSKIHRIPVRTWRKSFFDADPPPVRDIEKEVCEGNIPGERIGSSGFVIIYCDGDFNPVWPETKKPTDTGNSIADAILKKVAAN